MIDIEDLIQRLRYGVACHVSGVTGDLATDMTEAADALSALQADNATLRQQLQTERARLGVVNSAALGFISHCHDEFRTPAFDHVVQLRKELEEARNGR